MIILMQKQEILLMHLREGKSQREIARETGVDRKTIRKYIYDYEEKLKQLQEATHEIDRGELIQELVEAPRYHVNNREKRVVTDEIAQRIEDHLKENETKRAQGLHKQQKKPMDIFESLQAEGISISYSTVLRTIRVIEKKVKEAYIKGAYTPGDICEFDWGEVKLKIGGKLRTFQMAVFTSAYGNYRMAYLFAKQKTECFQEAHAMFFQEMGGVYHTMVYDNMRVAVKRFIGPNEKEPTDGLLKLSLYYGFAFRFCNTRRGNEKGHVERSVDVIRRKAFAFQDSFESFEEATNYLYSICMRLNHKERSYNDQTPAAHLEAERPLFLRLPEPFDAARLVTLRVDKYATVVIDQSHYSVPDHLVGEQVQVKIYTNRIHCFYNEQKIAVHPLLTGCHEWGLQMEHYLETLRKKPGALAGSAALQQADPKLKTIYTTYYISHERDFIELIHYLKEKATLSEVEQSIQELRRMGSTHVTTDKIKVICAKNRLPKAIPPLTSEETQTIMGQAERHLKLYDDLFHTTRVGQQEVDV